MCNPSLQQPLSTNVDGEGTEGSFWEWETGICHHPARRRGGAAVVLGLLACLPAIASEPRPSRPIPAFVAGMGSIGNMGRHVPCKGDALLRGTRGMARGQKARPRAVQLRRGECDSYSVGVRSKLLCMGLKMAGIEGGEEESSDDDDNDSFDGFDDHMYLGLSEPSFVTPPPRHALPTCLCHPGVLDIHCPVLDNFCDNQARGEKALAYHLTK